VDKRLERKIQMASEMRAATVDGWQRGEDGEEKINAACRAALNTPSGKLVMEYLKSITTNAVLPDTASDAQLRSMEGMRRLVGILDVRRNSSPKGEKE